MRRTLLKCVIALGGPAGALLVSTAAQAESVSPPAGADGVALQEIVVTAQKRSENIMQVPAAVSFVGGDSLARQHAIRLQDFAAYVPGFQVDTAGTPGQTTITLRGIAPLGSGSAVGTYIDDAPLGSSGLYALANLFQLDLLPYDLRAVEILRGPQGTLYGASTMGGLIKYELQEADPRSFHAAAGAEILTIKGSGGVGSGFRGMVNLPLVEDKLALRVSGFDQFTPGYIDNPVRRAHDINSVRQSGGRVALTWTPASDLKVNVDALHQRIASDDNAIVSLGPVGDTPPLGDLTSNLPLAQPLVQSTDFYKGAVNWTLPIGTLTSITSFSRIQNKYWSDATPVLGSLIEALTGAPGYSPQFVDITLRKFVEEVRLASPTGDRVEWLVGGFFTRERVSNVQAVEALDTSFNATAINPILTVSIPSTYKELAAFGNLTLHLTEKWSVAGGLRYSRNEQHFDQNTGGLLSLGAPESGASSESVTTYSVSSRYQFSRDSMLYGRVASGYQPGGPNVAIAGVPPTVSSATLTNYELGFKTRTFENRLLLDLSAYRIDWKKIQTIATTPTGIQYIVNGGEARTQGVEASAKYQATEALTLGANMAYTDAKFTTGIPTLGTVVGQRLPLVPRISGAATADYHTSLNADWDLQLGGGLRYVGSRPAYLFVAPLPPVAMPEASYVAVDLNGHLSHGPWSLGLFVKNLFDKRAYVTKTGLTDALTGELAQVSAAVLQPRTIGLSIDRTF